MPSPYTPFSKRYISARDLALFVDPDIERVLDEAHITGTRITDNTITIDLAVRLLPATEPFSIEVVLS